MAFVRVAQCRRREVFVIPCEHRLPEATLTAIVSLGSSGCIGGITVDAASSGESTRISVGLDAAQIVSKRFFEPL
jgi:hypothetical protein